MKVKKFEHVKISGITVCVPEKEINIYDELQYYGGNIKKVDRMRKMVGFWKRRVADLETTPADLAYDAAKERSGTLFGTFLRKTDHAHRSCRTAYGWLHGWERRL